MSRSSEIHRSPKNDRFSASEATRTFCRPKRSTTHCENQTTIIPSTLGFRAVLEGDHADRVCQGFEVRRECLDLQRDALQAAGVASERIYEDRASGRLDARPGLDACLKAVRSGDTLVVWKVDRLGRNLKHLVSTIEDLRERNIGFSVLAGHGAQLDTTTPNGRLVFGLFAVLAEFERQLIAERTRAGLAAARARGRSGGRPRKMDRSTLQMAMSAMADPKACATAVAKRLGITTGTLYTYVNSDGTPKALGSELLRGT